MTERIVVVQNPKSTRAGDVQKRVLQRLDDTGTSYERYQTVASDTDDNINNFRELLRDGDRVISAAGDGTASQIVNAILLNNHENTQIGFLPFGNFNDLPHGFGTKKDDILKLVSSKHARDVRPISIGINGEHWRDAPAYTTLGWTAIAASRFGNSEFRDTMQKQPELLKLARSMGKLGIDYFHNRDQYLPAFISSHSLQLQEEVTDIIALNNSYMGRIIRANSEEIKGSNFAYSHLDVSGLWKNAPFLMRAAFHSMPSDLVNDISIKFQNPATVPIQTEGEFREFENVTDLTLFKNKTPIHVLEP